MAGEQGRCSPHANARSGDEAAHRRQQIGVALDRLADGKTKAPGFDGKLVSKVRVDGIRDELKTRGFLEKNETGGLTDTGRSHFRRAKTLLLSAGKILENEGLIWRK